MRVHQAFQALRVRTLFDISHHKLSSIAVTIKKSYSRFQGQCFVAVDPEAFAPGFADRLSDLMQHCRNLEPVSLYIGCRKHLSPLVRWYVIWILLSMSVFQSVDSWMSYWVV
jgi:hypothetical protein